jgi:hypothetical protein
MIGSINPAKPMAKQARITTHAMTLAVALSIGPAEGVASEFML